MGNKSNHNRNNKKTINDLLKKEENQNDLDKNCSCYCGVFPPSLMDYKYSKRRVRYYSEKMEISEDEKKLISETKADNIDFYEFPSNNEENIKVIIDTDLGTDWDDAMALSYALRIPNLEILGITTNYGIPDLRALIVKKIIDIYSKTHPNKKPIPIISGASRPLGSHRELIIFWHEGKPFYGRNELNHALEMETIMNREQEKASDFIVSMLNKYPGQVKIISIGIPTNIGLVLSKHKEVIPLIKEIVIMGCGDFMKNNGEKIKQNEYDEILNDIKNGNKYNLFPNHNISGDTLGTKIIFDSGVKLKIVNHSVSSKFIARGELIDYFREKAKNVKDLNNIKDIDEAIGLLMNEWFNVRYLDRQITHDPLTINEAVYGGDKSPLIYLRGRIIIHEWAAFSTFIPQKNGPHYLSVKIKDNIKFLEFLKQTIMNSNL